MLHSCYCLVVIPLLAETHLTELFHRILVVDAPEALQIRRVMDRDGVEQRQAQRILAAQASRTQRLALADDTIDNSGDLRELDARVAALHRKYLALATHRSA